MGLGILGYDASMYYWHKFNKEFICETGMAVN